MNSPCPDLEVLFAELAEGQGPALDHSASCAACSAVLEEHRQLEKDLFRLQDPLPPSTFVAQVMAKVARAPAPSSVELRQGFGILGFAVALAVTVLVARGATAGEFGVAIAHGVIDLRAILMGLLTGIAGVWKTAALPVTAALAFVLMLSLAGLKKLAGTEVPAKV